MCGFFLANFPCWMDFYLLRCALFSLFDKKTTQKFADYKFSCTFATAIENETIGRLAQLVQSICLTSRGSAVRIRQRPLNEFLVNHCFFFLGRLAQLVQSICLTSRGSAVRIRQRPPPKRKIIRAFSSAGSEHLPYKQRVGGSNPSTPTPKYNCQLSPYWAFSSAGSEHLPYKQRVGGSNPSTPTSSFAILRSFPFLTYMQTLILADNQDVTRYGMKAIAAGLYPVCAYVEALDWKSLAESLAEYPEACVVLDYTLLDCSVEQLLVLHERFPKADFVLFSDQLGRDFVRRMLLAGSSFHVLMKDAPLAEVNQCLCDVNGGCQFVCGKAKDLLREEEKEQNRIVPLTQTEKEILRAMALGKSTKEIAAERFLSVYTVATHRKNIFRKLEVNNAHEAIRYALRAGIVNTVEYCI